MEFSFTPEIPLDDKGNIDVTKEMEIFNLLKEQGLDIGYMEDLLFSDIEEYRAQREAIREMLIEEGWDLEGSESELETPALQDQEEDILLVGAPLDDLDLTAPAENVNIENKTVQPPSEEIFPDSVGVDETESEITSESNSLLSKDILDLSDEERGPGEQEEETAKENGKLKTAVRGRSIFKPILIGIIAIVIVLLIGGGSYYLLTNENEENGTNGELKAELFISDLNPVAGSLVNLSSEAEGAGTTYLWKIIPEDYHITSGSRSSRYLEVFFHKPSEYRIDLEVNRGTETKSDFKYIQVSNLDVGAVRERFGDRYEFDISGKLVLENVHTLFDDPEASKFEVMKIEYWTESSNPMDLEIMDSVFGHDGFMDENYQVLRKTSEFLRFSGSISQRGGGSSAVTGSSQNNQENFIDLYTKRPVRIRTLASMSINVPVSSSVTLDYDVEEDLDIYPDLKDPFTDLRMEDLTEDRIFSIGEEGIAKWGGFDLIWKASRADRFDGEPSIVLEFQMDEPTKRKLDIKEFYMEHTVRNDVPIPVRTIINVTSEDSIRNPYTIDHGQELLIYEEGEEIIVFGSVNYIHDEVTSIDQSYPILSSEFHDDWDMIPKAGSIGGTFNSQNDPEERIQITTSSTSYSLWEKDKDGLFAVHSNFSGFASVEQWKFSICNKGSEWAWNSTVVSNSSQGTPRRIEPVDTAKADLDPVLTFSGAEFAIKGLLSDLNSDLSSKLYGRSVPVQNDELRSQSYSMGIDVDHKYPVAGMINPTLSRPLEMCMVIRSQDGTLELGLDMTNGQLAYVHQRSVTK